MIISVSKDFESRFKCRMSRVSGPVNQREIIDAWSAHVFRLGRTPHVLFMHDASLWHLIINAKGITGLDKLLPLFFTRIREVWHLHGAAFDDLNQSVLFMPRANRTLIGSMNEAIQHIKALAEMASDQEHCLSTKEIEDYMQQTPYSALEHVFPDRSLKRLLSD